MRRDFRLPVRVRLREFLICHVVPRGLAVAERVENFIFRRLAVVRTEPLPLVQRNAVLVVMHGHGGGADKQALADVARFRAEGLDVYILTFQLMRRRFVLHRNDLGAAPEFFTMPWQWQKLRRCLRAAGLAETRLHHVRFWPFYALAALPGLLREVGGNTVVILHDFLYLCPRLHLLDGDYKFCGLPRNDAACTACIARSGSFTGFFGDVAAWRQAAAAILQVAQDVVAPSADTMRHYQKVFPDLAVQVHPHATEEVAAVRRTVTRRRGPLRLAVVGHMMRHKGADIVVRLAEYCAAHAVPLDLRMIGACVYKDELTRLGVPVTGRYAPQDLAGHLRAFAPDYIWIPSPCPETYSFLLGEVWALGYPVLAFDIGAIAERVRLRASSDDVLIPLDLTQDSPALAGFLHNLPR